MYEFDAIDTVHPTFMSRNLWDDRAYHQLQDSAPRLALIEEAEWYSKSSKIRLIRTCTDCSAICNWMFRLLSVIRCEIGPEPESERTCSGPSGLGSSKNRLITFTTSSTQMDCEVSLSEQFCGASNDKSVQGTS